MMKKIIIFSLIVNFAFAQKVNLETLTQKGLDQNRDLALALKRVDLQKALVNTAYEVPKTKIDYSFGNIQTPNVWDYSLSAIQNVELPKVFKLRKAYNESLVKIGESEVSVLRNEYRMNVSTFYYALYSLNKLKTVLEKENLKLSEIEKVYKRRFEEGESDILESSNVRLRILENEMKIAKINQQENEILAQLKILLNISDIPELDFQNAAAVLVKTYDGNPRLGWQKSMIESSKSMLETEKSKLLPSINLGVLNQSMAGSWRQFVGMVGVEMPIFTKAQKSRVEASKINVLIQESELEKIVHQIDNEVISLRGSLLNIENQIEMLNKQLLPSSEKVMEISHKKYMAAQITYYDWYLAYNQNLTYKSELISLEKERNVKISTIKYLTGNE
ncbi:TolC family protein [Lacihabitans sp. LS3-19]|uniref:TolC family protein n=1 Tax=Lacihabitans sp. LS3-19 TaxID=2487335 RepID=UPI0020CEC2AC|nr:TolC family protein [Lacihabitans sp. LS3-19]MCP9768953.1 TolC family protein [Lacihabitans sp. LS3-19]